jgi:AraC-like DNA-binding protein
LIKSNDIVLATQIPEQSIAAFVESFWMLHNQSDAPKEVVILPDGRIDLFLTKTGTDPFCIKLLGLGKIPAQTTIPPHCKIYAISFNPISIEYLFKKDISTLINQAENLGSSFWNFTEVDLESFEDFCTKAMSSIMDRLPANIDQRKKALFDFIYADNGAMTVNEMADRLCWTSRQINRYFNRQFGLSLKAYCSIIRFRAAFPELKRGKVFPDGNYADQPHFIKEVKKLSGFSPKRLVENQNDRFIQFSTLSNK